ncbi:MAG: AI-2E family transporter [Rhodoferax sp.]|nr:AI-2E family transporter [Rhodoferax sp.]
MQFTPTQKRFAVWGLISGLIVLALWLLAPVLAPFVVASVLAYALTPLVNRLDRVARGRVPRLVAVVVVELLFGVLALGMLLLIVPILAKELPLMREQLPVLLDSINVSLKPWLAQWGVHVTLDVASLKSFLTKYLNANVEDLAGSVLASVKLGGSVAFALIGNAILIPVALFYLLMDWDRFVAKVRDLVPVRMRGGVNSFLSEADEVLGQYLRGQLLVMSILAVGYSIGLALFGLDLAVPIGVFTGLAIFVPYLGFGIGLVLATLAGLLEFSSGGVVYPLVMVAVVYGIGQMVESLYLTPTLVGERIGLHPLAVIFALLAFGQLFGFVGVLIALPASAVLLVAIRRVRAGYLASPLYLG